jgi:Major Facilitator Superfamily.
MIFYILMAIIAPYCVQNLHTSTGIAGLISGIFLIGILTGRLGIGRIVQEVGSKKILLVGTFLHILSSLFYLFASNVLFLFGTRFFHGIAFGIAHTGASTIAAQVRGSSRVDLQACKLGTGRRFTTS